MSIQFWLTKCLIRMLGLKHATGLPPETLLPKVRVLNQRIGFALPQDGRFDYADEPVVLATHCHAEDRFHTLVIRPRREHAEPGKRRAILCVYGGGLTLAPARMMVGYAKDLAARTGTDVWFPYYPLCTDYSIRESVRMLHAVYEKMCAEYADVRWYGYSSGGALLTLLGAYLNELRSPLPRPRRLVLVSPGGVPVSADEWEHMEALDNGDFMLSVQYLRTLIPLLGQEDVVPPYMLTMEGADLSGLPETWVYYGTAEILSVKLPAYERALRAAGVKYHTRVAQGMPHCYCVTVYFPEAREDYEEIVGLLKEELPC